MEVAIVAALHGHGLRAEFGFRSRRRAALQVPASIAEFERGVLQEVIGGGGLRLLQLEIVEVGRARAAAHAEGEAAGRRRGRERGGHALPAVFDGGGRAGIRQQDGLLRASALHDGLQPRAAAPAQVRKNLEQIAQQKIERKEKTENELLVRGSSRAGREDDAQRR